MKLTDLLAIVRCSIDEKWAASKSTDSQPADAKAAMPDYQAVLAEVSVRVEAVEALVVAIADLTKAEATAAAALGRVMTKLQRPSSGRPCLAKAATPLHHPRQSGDPTDAA